MEANVIDMKGKKIDTIDLPGEIFDAPVNVDMMHQAFVRQLANQRLGTHSTKGRSEVSGGGRKPWRQKGTGRARQGSIRAAQWVGGGKIFTPKPRSYDQKMPKKMRRAALCSAITQKFITGDMFIVEEFSLKEPRTKLMVAAVEKISGSQDCLIVYPERDENYDMLMRAINNLTKADLILADYLNIRDLLGHEKVILVKSGLDRISEILLRE
ncbi:MAG: 50S ribosomal protein L4 [Anaerolineales bacterium]|nr:MAG: 50S ribosomal protein L4 [Anaerolineales bacterium]